LEIRNDVAAVIEIVGKNYRLIGEKFGNGKLYGCLALRGSVDTQWPLKATIPFGEIPADSGCYVYAPEKIERLVRHPDDWLSYQSRNPDKKEWGGAIRLHQKSKIIRFMGWSAHPEKVDEAFMLAISVLAHLMTMDAARICAVLSENEHFMPVFETMRAGH
jgi:hypothetical protein